MEQMKTWRLSDPGMDLLERAGLAALYMSLRAAEERGVNLHPMTWTPEDLTETSVTVRWTGPARPAFESLFRWAWSEREGVLYLPAVQREPGDRDQILARIVAHNGILSTFLQHPRVQPKAEAEPRIETLDEGKEIEVRYLSLQGKTLKPHADLDEMFDRKGALAIKLVEMSSWVFPGIAPRYAKEGAWRGEAASALLLMLAPIVCLYQRLFIGNSVVIIPDVRDLFEFDQVRPFLRVDPSFVDVASLGEAALRFSSAYLARALQKESVSSRSIVMGKVDYYQSQSVRKGIFNFDATPIAVRRFQRLQQVMPNRYVVIRTESAAPEPKRKAAKKTPDSPRASGFFRVPSGRGRIAQNLAEGADWYRDLFEPLPWDADSLEQQRKRSGGSIEELWFTNLRWQRSALLDLIQEESMWSSEQEKFFVETLWDVYASLYAQEAEAVARGGSRDVSERIEHCSDEIRRNLMRAKTRNLLRATVMDLVARAGRTRRVRERPDALWRMLDDPQDWKKGRDLALLALASYPSKKDRNQEENV